MPRRSSSVLTDTQRAIFDGFVADPRLLVRGGAGTGKTVLAVSEAERLAASGHRVLLTCTSSGLARAFGTALSTHPSITCVGAAALVTNDIVSAGLSADLPDAGSRDMMQRFLPELAARASRDRPARFDALVVDEAQDLLSPYWLEYFDANLVGGLTESTWRVFMDPNQDLLLGNTSEGVDQLDDIATSHYRLTKNCRNTRQIGLATAMMTGLDISDTLQAEGVDVIEHFYASPAQQHTLARSVLCDWLKEGVRPEDVVVLSSHPLRDSVVAGISEHDLGCPIVETDQPEVQLNGSVRFASYRCVQGFRGRRRAHRRHRQSRSGQQPAGALRRHEPRTGPPRTSAAPGHSADIR